MTTTLCIVGAGPRGVAVLERLHAAHRVPGPRTVVHLVDPHLGDGGAVWRVDQPSDLLMNTVAAQITMFTDASVETAGPIVPGPSLHEWAHDLDRLDPDGLVPPDVRRLCRSLGPDTYPTRACYGHYLCWVLDELRRTAPDRLEIVGHRAVATSLREAADGTQTVTLSDGRVLDGLGAVVLAQGHVPSVPAPADAALAEQAGAAGLRHVLPGNPADGAGGPDDGPGPGTTVAVRGLGLTFFDHMALLTSGRGGRFVRGDDGELRYHPSGREPRLVVGSRRGLPYHARGENQKGPYGRHTPRFLTPWTVAGLRRRADAGRPADFRDEVWPLIDREVRSVYYEALVRAERGAAAAAELVEAYVAVADLSAQQVPDGDALAIGESAAERALLAAHGVGGDRRWSWDAVARPWRGVVFDGPRAHRDALLTHLRADVAAARRGNVDDPVKAALDALRDLRNEVRLVVDHGGVGGRSHRRDVHGWYTPLNAFLSIGPPASRIEELVALMEAGIVDVVAPGMRVAVTDDGSAFEVRSPALPGVVAHATTLIEARLPEPDLQATTDPLLTDLFDRGGCARHTVPDPDGAGHRTAGLSVTRRPYHLVDARGVAHPRRFAYGIPTEGVHWVTAAGIRPGVNSVILADADAIAAAAHAAAERPVAVPSLHAAG